MNFDYMYAVGYSAVMLAAVFVVGYLVARAPFVRRFYLPTALIAGLILLFFSPQIMGNLNENFQLSKGFYEIWKIAPKYLINVVFACLFLAHPMMSVKKIWKVAGPQVAFGQMIAWGQYALAGILTLFVLVPIFAMPEAVASLLEISFEGGHGTVAGMSNVFKEFNFSEGQDIANGLATASLITSLLLGIILINWGKKRGHLKPGGMTKIARNKVYYHKIVNDLHEQGMTLREHLTFKRTLSHIGLVLLSLGIGVAIHAFLSQLEELTWARAGVKIMPFMPLFTFCMIGGMIAGQIVRSLGMKISRTIIDLISAVALSGLIMTAIGTMNLSFFNNHAAVFGLLYGVGVIWIFFCFIFLARKMFPEYWFQNAIISFGQSMGMTATGLLFAQMVDPKSRTNAVESFGYKQLLFEPLMGGGIVTALSMPLIYGLGLPLFTAICGGITVAWLLLGLLYFGHKKRRRFLSKSKLDTYLED